MLSNTVYFYTKANPKSQIYAHLMRYMDNTTNLPKYSKLKEKYIKEILEI